MTNSRDQYEIFAEGVLEILANGDGFLRSPDDNHKPGPGDIYVSLAKKRRVPFEDR
jgi:transcription termination factor Rho